MRELERGERLRRRSWLAPPRSPRRHPDAGDCRDRARRSACVSSISAASPSARTLAMMAATASLTSDGCLALHRQQCLEAVLEIGVGSLEPKGHGKALKSRRRPACCPHRVIAGVLGSRAGAPDEPEILELGLDAFDLELDRGIAGEGERHAPARSIARLEADRQQRQDAAALKASRSSIWRRTRGRIRAPSAAADSPCRRSLFPPAPNRNG